jgi:hypothetical protein
LLFYSTCCQHAGAHMPFVLGPEGPADECSPEAACPALPCTRPFLLRMPRRAEALLIRCILTSQVLHLQATLSSGRVLLGAGFGKADSIFSCKVRCAAALSASNPVPLPRAPACSLHAFLKPLSLQCCDVGASMVPAALLEDLIVILMVHVRRPSDRQHPRVAFANEFSISMPLDV